MRLDKYLKVSQLIKRRTVAAQACDEAHVAVNGKPAKPSHTLKEGDLLDISFGKRRVSVRVLTLKEHVLKSEAGAMYEVVSETSAE